MKQKMMKGTVACLLLSSLGITTACIDNSYDLTKDIDMTVTVGGNLTTPGNSTEDITLEDLLDIDTLDSDLKLDAEGNYRLEMNGDPTNSTVKVNDVIVDGATANKASREMTFAKWMLTDIGEDGKKQTIPLPIEDLNPEWELKNDDVPSDVVQLEYAGDIRNNDISLKLNLSGSAKNVRLKAGMTFTFPSYLEVDLKDPYTQSWLTKEEKNGKTVLKLKKDYPLSSSGAQWYITLTKIYFKSVDGITIPNGEGFIRPETAEKGKVYFNVEIPVDGDVYLKEEDFPAGVDQVDFALVSHVESKDMTMGKVKAIVDPEIDFKVSDVVIENLPDFLTDNEVTADLYNPQIYLNVNNQTPVEVNFKAQLIALKGNETKATISLGTDRDKFVEGTSIRLKPNNNIICLCPHPEEIEGNSTGVTFIKVETLPDLIKTIPDTIKVKVDNKSAQVIQEYCEVELGEEFNVTTDYSIKAPLEFGNEFNISYNDTINGWSEDIEDFEMKEVEVSLNAVNAIPLNLSLSATAIDVHGNEIPDVEVSVLDPNKSETEEDTYIMAGSLNEKKTTSLIITLRTKDGISRIKNLDGLILSLKGYADPANDEQILNKNQTLKLDDLKLRIKGGVTLNLDK